MDGEPFDLSKVLHVVPYAIFFEVIVAAPIFFWLLNRGWWPRLALAAALALPAAAEIGVWRAVDHWGSWSFATSVAYGALLTIGVWMAYEAGLRQLSVPRGVLLVLAGGTLGFCTHQQATSARLVALGSAVLLGPSLVAYALGRRTVRSWEREREERLRLRRVEEERAREAGHRAALAAAEERARTERERARREEQRSKEEEERRAKQIEEDRRAEDARQEARRLASAQEIAVAESVREDEAAGRSVRDIIGRERAVLESLYVLADGRTSAKVSLANLSAKAGLTLAQCQRSCGQLEERGHVRIQNDWEPAEWHNRSVWITAKGTEAVGRHLEKIPDTPMLVGEAPEGKRREIVVLYLTASPREETFTDAEGNVFTSELQRLRVDQEYRSVKSVLMLSKFADSLRIEHAPAASFGDLIAGLNHYAPQVVSFSGHSSPSGILLDSDQLNGPGRTLYFSTLRRLIAASATPPRLLLLNSCDSLSGADELLGAVEVVVGMPTATVDIAAVTFAQRFYGALAARKSLHEALEQGNAALEYTMPEGVEFREPEIRARPGIDPRDFYL